MENNENETRKDQRLSETAREHGSGDQLENKDKQMHENRINPEKDHVPGHMGYNVHENLEGVNPTSSTTKE